MLVHQSKHEDRNIFCPSVYFPLFETSVVRVVHDFNVFRSNESLNVSPSWSGSDSLSSLLVLEAFVSSVFHTEGEGTVQEQ